jgi:hypothetical protein
MPHEPNNPILAAALGLMEAAIPGMFENPEDAWRAYVPSMRYVVIERTEAMSVEQLKFMQSFSGSFVGCEAKNLLEIRRAIGADHIRLEPIGEAWASANLEALVDAGIRAHLEPLSDEEQRERLKILDDLPPPDPV